jgi:transcriptional regulator GlxA family with amidase domain
MNRYWRSSVDYLVREIYAADSGLAHPLIQAQAAEMLAAGILATFPNTATLAGYTRGPGLVGPAALRRAMTFVDANADRPITAIEIADAANLGLRGLEKVFSAHLGVTPMGYARRVRLQRAHQDLLAADPATGATVKAIAARWGFANSDRFSRAYRETFGVLPSQSLRG